MFSTDALDKEIARRVQVRRQALFSAAIREDDEATERFARIQRAILGGLRHVQDVQGACNCQICQP